MQLRLHPTRPEAISVSGATLTRWSLEERPAAKIVDYTSPDWQVQSSIYIQDGRETFLGGITGAPDGMIFALEQPRTFPMQQFRRACAVSVG